MNALFCICVFITCVYAMEIEHLFFKRNSVGFLQNHANESSKISVEIESFPDFIVIKCHILNTEIASWEIHKNRVQILSFGNKNDAYFRTLSQTRTIIFSGLKTLEDLQMMTVQNFDKNQFEIRLEVNGLWPHPIEIL